MRALLLWSVGLLWAGSILANESIIREKLSNYMPELEVHSVRETPVNGLYEVLAGPSVAYASADGEYLFQGELLALADTTNLSKAAKRRARLHYLEQIPNSDMIVFKAPIEKHRIYVFTDIDCGYCRKFHHDIPALNAKGITVQYLAFPRAAIGSDSYLKAVSVWCAANQHSAMGLAKAGKPLNLNQCPNPVHKQRDLGVKLGVSGTPSMFLEDGRLIYGYVGPDRLEYLINQKD